MEPSLREISSLGEIKIGVVANSSFLPSDIKEFVFYKPIS
jgi:hypothetical protein